MDRYRPHRFTELLGNERVARETMAWVKQWDFCVFGKNKGKKRPRDDDENYNPDDEYHRPREKVIAPITWYDFVRLIFLSFSCYRVRLDWERRRWRMLLLSKRVTKSWKSMPGLLYNYPLHRRLIGT